MSKDDSTGHIIQSLAINITIAVVKGVAAFLTGSGSMLAEAIHSSADCANQLLLLVGVKQGKRAPDASHPLGYGRAVYFWSFMVALLLFSGGGVFSIYEGIHKIVHPEPVEKVWLGVGILVASLFLEGAATISNMREINRRRGKLAFGQYLRDTKDSDLIVVFGENSAAVLGVVFAIFALLASWFTGDGHWDGYGSVAIGLVLVGVAVFLAREVQSLLIGESADGAIAETIDNIVRDGVEYRRVLHLITVQQGPGEVMVAVKLAFKEDVSGADVCVLIDAFEAKLRAARPDVRWCFVEPDVPRDEPSAPSRVSTPSQLAITPSGS